MIFFFFITEVNIVNKAYASQTTVAHRLRIVNYHPTGVVNLFSAKHSIHLKTILQIQLRVIHYPQVDVTNM